MAISEFGIDLKTRKPAEGLNYLLKIRQEDDQK